MFMHSDETNPFLALFIISLCLVGALGTWFSGTVIMPELAERVQLGETQQVWLTNAVQSGFVVGALLIAFFNLSDSMTLTKLIAFSCGFAAAANLLLLFADTPIGIITLRFITGVALSGVYPPVVKLVATWFKTGRGIAMGIIIGALTIGSAMPHLFRAMVTDENWIHVIWISSAFTFLIGLVFLFVISEGPFAFDRTEFKPIQILQVLSNKSFYFLNVGYIGHMWELYAMWAWILTFARIPEANLNLFSFLTPEYFSFFVVSIGAIGCVIVGRLSDVFGRCYTTAILMFTSGSCAFLIGFSIEVAPALFVFVAFIWGFTIISDSGQFSAAATELAESHLVGTALTVQMALGFGITILAIWLVPLSAHWFGSFQWAFLLLFPGPFIGALAMLLLRRRPDAVKLALGKR